MKNKNLIISFHASCFIGLLTSAQIARADAIPYSDVGTPNTTLYAFTAAATGDIEAYFAGSSAGYDTEIGMLVNGTSTGIIGLDDHTSTVGQSLDLGSVTAGDTIVFELINNSLGLTAYSDPSLNLSYDVSGETANGHNHIYSTAYTRTADIPGDLPIPLSANIPAGTYVAFEDLPFNGQGASQNGNSDFDYNDETFIFTDIATTTSTVPDTASSLTLLSIGFAGVGLLRRRLCA
jgi:hypothetical protein